MICRVDFSKPEYKYLYSNINELLSLTAIKNNRDTELVLPWCLRLVANDLSLALFLDLDLSHGVKIHSHCLAENYQSPTENLWYVRQLESKITKNQDFTAIVLDVLAKSFPVLESRLRRIIIDTSMGRLKSLTKEHSFSIEKIVLSKEIKPQEIKSEPIVSE